MLCIYEKTISFIIIFNWRATYIHFWYWNCILINKQEKDKDCLTAKTKLHNKIDHRIVLNLATKTSKKKYDSVSIAKITKHFEEIPQNMFDECIITLLSKLIYMSRI